MRSLIVGGEELERRRAGVAASPELAAIGARLAGELRELVARPLYVPEAKALLSRWGAACRDDSAELAFDPWSPQAQRCSRCGRVWSTEQSHRWWVYWYQLWLAERCWQLALAAVLDGDARFEARALEILSGLAARYPSWPNADNALGPSHPFFSTYLESIWVLQLAAAASLLGERGRLPAGLERDLAARLFRPSAETIADFVEPGSNRQAWNAAALFALGSVLDDAGLRERAARGPDGILATLEGGLRADGLWYEGENYHWFALRGLAWGAELLRAAGVVDLWSAEDAAAAKFREAFWTPVLTALPDFTFPARRDSRFGVSLRQRRMAELWELALARTGRDGLGALLEHVYDASVPVVEGGRGVVTEVERAEPASGLRRSDLGWKGLVWALPALPPAPARAWPPPSAHLEGTGLAVFRRDGGRTYASLDYGESGGGHGHPDRLNLTLHAGGVPWLADFGTGSYVSPTLGWYRSTLAHNAPLVDALSQGTAEGACVGYAEGERFGWVCAQLPEGAAYDGVGLQRTMVVTPDYVLDVVQMASAVGERMLALPWHGWGRVTSHPTGLTFVREDGTLQIHLAGRQPFQVQLSTAPGPPVDGHDGADLQFAVVVSTGEEVTLAACVSHQSGVEELECHKGEFVVRMADGGMHSHAPTEHGWRIDLGRGDPVELGGAREPPDGAAPAPVAAAGAKPEARPVAAASLAVRGAPALDGTLDGFRLDAPLALDRAEQFRRAEEPWAGAEAFSARAWLNHQGSTLYVAVDVTAPGPAFRPRGEADPEWDNENPDIHSDGIQVYVEAVSFLGWLIVPDGDDPEALKVSAVRGTDASPEMVRGAWSATGGGYRITCALELPDDVAEFGFDLCVNRFREGRERRVGQLVWSGAGGARLYLAGDRPLAHRLPLVAARS
ncbi:MAG TPA: heparinase II/III family protein [Gemmatimonadales bacterium]|nr:heparinase II/III family protein [Gemmatimonadales bacterium]